MQPGNGDTGSSGGGRRRFVAFSHKAILLIAVALAIFGGGVAAVASVITAGPKADGTAIIPNGWRVTPAGQQVQLGDKPFGMAMSPDGHHMLVSNDGQGTQSLMSVDTAQSTVEQTVSYKSPQALYLGVVYSPDGKHAYASAGGNNKIRVYGVNGDQLTEREPITLPTTRDGSRTTPYPAGLAISPDGGTLYVANNLDDSMSFVDLATGTVEATVPVGHNPYTVLLSRDGSRAYVSNWGAQTVSVIDTEARSVTDTIHVGTHPDALALSPQRDELYVTNSDSDTVSVIDPRTNLVIRTINLAPYKGAQSGSSPNALAVSPDGNTLYVANAGNNDVDVIRLAKVKHDGRGRHKAGKDKIEGMIPTAWYPTALGISHDGSRLFIANAKGLGAGPNADGQYIGSMIKGTLSTVDVPNRAQLARYTRQVIRNNGFDERGKVRVSGGPGQRVIPQRPGEPSPIKHVIYVIKENRTYDQVLGDLPKGNGDPSLTLFGEDVTPNQHELARRFVTLDNLYADAEVSADGWNWSTGALANTYTQKNWPANYSGRGRGYDFEGGNFATAPNKDPENAYIWDRLDRARVSYRNYGFWTSGTVPAVVSSTEPQLATHTDTNYPGFNMAIRDQTRVDEWLREFRGYEQEGALPTAELVRLPDDHTAGTSPGYPTPKAMVADNDLALGRIVDAVSHSGFWKSTAIFVIEDDAQAGPDHVDAHRTEAQVISPYTQIGKVDSTLYDTSAMLRTMELIIGLSPMTQYDASATPMLNSFTNKPDLTTYSAITPKQSLDEVNGRNAAMAKQSEQMDFSVEDRAPEQQLNRAIWKSVKGSDSKMPAPRSGMPQSEHDPDD